MAQGNLVRMVFGNTFSIARSTWHKASKMQLNAALTNGSHRQTTLSICLHRGTLLVYLRHISLSRLFPFVDRKTLKWNSIESKATPHLFAPGHRNSRIHVVYLWGSEGHRLVGLFGFNVSAMPRQSHLHLRHLPEAWIELVQNMWACPLSCLQMMVEFEMKMINEIKDFLSHTSQE